MAKQTNIPPVSVPSPMELAREAAKMEKEDNVRSFNDVKTHEDDQKTSINDRVGAKTGKISLDVSDIAIEQKIKVTRTFSIDTFTDQRIQEASTRLHCPKSAIIEKAFNTWYDAIEKALESK